MPATAENTRSGASIESASIDALGTEITELCTCIYAATYRLLVLIREFDERMRWRRSRKPISMPMSHRPRPPTADRYQVVVHVSAETSRRLQCDCSRIMVIEAEDGEPFSIGRKSRTIQASIRRALRFRDRSCRFPGCTHTRCVDGHHIRHWANGGETSLDNFVQLCRFHHRLVHEGGYG